MSCKEPYFMSELLYQTEESLLNQQSLSYVVHTLNHQPSDGHPTRSDEIKVRKEYRLFKPAK